MQEPLFGLDSEGAAKSSRADRPGLKFREPVEAELWPLSLGEKIPQDHLARKIARAVSLLDVSALFRTYTHRGGYPYDPRLLLATVLYGMTEGVRSSRELQEHCKFDLRYRFLMGGLEPDDRTFGRFLLRMEPFLENILRQVLQRAKKSGRGKGNEVIVDGCRVPCSASWWKYRASEETPSDPDARIMKSHGRPLVGYNALVAMDSADGLIVGAELSNAVADWRLSEPAVAAMKRQHGELPCALVGDSGFESHESIAALEAMGVDTVFCPSENLNEHLALNEDGELVCPVGRLIVQTGNPNLRKDGRVTARFGPEGGCRNCPLMATCAFKGKRIEANVGVDPGARYRNKERCQSAAYSGAMFRRRRIERVFARLRRHDKFERFLRRGLVKARAELLFWVIAYDIRELGRRRKFLFRLFFAVLSVVKRQHRVLQICNFVPLPLAA
jgi:transposase